MPTHAIYLAPGLSAPTTPAAGTVAAMTVRTGTAIAATAVAGTHVVETGGLGARLRAAPGTDAKIVGRVADGGRVTDTGQTATVAGRLWRRVTAAGGLVAWMDAGLLSAVR